MKRFQWNKGDKVENLIRCLANYKAQMEYKNIDLKADKVKQYEAVREAMARIYEEEPTLFGPPVITPMPAPVDQVDEGEVAEIQRKQSATKRPNCERSNAPIFTIRVLGAILILRRLFARNFIFSAKANISARAEVRHVIATKFQPGRPG